MKNHFILSLLSYLFLNISCETSKKSNKTEIVSENISELQTKLNISNFKPEKAKFQFIAYDNSNGLIDGPSDSFLQAELFYDKTKIDSLKGYVEKDEVDLQIMDSDRFLNKWFDSKLVSEIGNTQKNLKVYNDFLFNTNGQIILLENTILYKK